jgi:hypothetical protein
MTSALVPKQERQSIPDSFDWFPTGMANSAIDPATGESLEYQQLIKRDKYCKTWTRSFANDLGRLAQGIRDIEGTNTIFSSAMTKCQPTEQPPMAAL